MNSYKHKALSPLLARTDLWQASSLSKKNSGIDTGFSPLNQALHQGGWPKSGLVEILSGRTGSAELMLLMPSLAKLSQLPGWLVLIAPPYIPYAPAMQHQGANLSRIIIAHPRNTSDLLWCTEQALKSSGNSVVSWLNSPHITYAKLRKLQLACLNAPGLSALIRPAYTSRQNSPSHLRLSLSSSASSLHLHIIKQQGGWAGQQLQLTPDLPPHNRQLKADQLPVHRATSYWKQRQLPANALSSIRLSSLELAITATTFAPQTRN